jgi:hypothetical protein
MKIGDSVSFVIGSLTLSLDRTNLIAPGLGVYAYRVTEGQPSAVPGIAGYPLQGRVPFDPYWFFDCKIVVSESQFQIFNEILVQSQNNGIVTLNGARQSIIEDTPRTRALASGTSEISGSPTGTKQYFAKYQVLINTGEQYWKFAGEGRDGLRNRYLNFQAVELLRVSV